MFPLKNTEAYIHANGFRSTLGKELADRDVEINELGSEIQALTNKLTDEVNTRAKLGAHNLLCSNIPTTNKNNASVVLNSDGSYTVSTSSATSGAVYLESTQSFTLDVGTYTFTDTLNGETAQTTDALGVYVTGINGSSDWFRANAYRELVVTQKSTVKFGLYLATNVTASTPITFYPMIHLATDADSTYQPYAKTNVELTADVETLNDVTVTDVTSSFTDITSGTITMIKCGKIRQLQFDNVAFPGDASFPTLDAADRPKAVSFGSLTVTSDNTSGRIWLRVNGTFGTGNVLGKTVMGALTWIAS